MAKISYQSLLISELESRKKRNPMYSLRRFADSLGVPASRLSLVLRGKSGISAKRAREISFRLFNDDKQRELFITLVEAKHSRSPFIKDQANKKINQWFTNESLSLSFEKFSLIRNWYHYSILELTELDQFRSDVSWIASVLGITELEARDAIDRLVELELLDTSVEPWTQKDKELGTQNGVSNLAVREHHKQILDQVIERIDSVPLDKRFLNSTTMAIKESKVAEAKIALKKFRDQFCREIQDSESKDALYVFSMQLFPLLKKNGDEMGRKK